VIFCFWECVQFQTSLFLWPFAAGVELTALVFADLVE
jgi:hypothetical protein